MDFEVPGGPSATLQRCSDLDLSQYSGLEPREDADDHHDDCEESNVSLTSSVKELIRFEALENAAETHDSFVSTTSYAERLWTKNPFFLMPPSEFEEINDTRNEISGYSTDNSQVDADPMPESEVTDTGKSSNQGTNLLLTLPAVVDHKTALELNPDFASDSETDDDDTRSLASLSLFHASVPVIMSTPSAKGMKKSRSEDKATKIPDELRESLPPSDLVRKLFPVPGRVTSAPAISESVKETAAESSKSVNGILRFGEGKSGGSPGQSTTLFDSRMNTARMIHVGDGVIIKELQNKLAELKSEMGRFKTETAKLTKARLECDATLKQLAKDRDRFTNECDARMRQIDEIQRTEMKKLEMEKKILYKHVNLQKQNDTQRLVEANQDLMTEIAGLLDELKKSEGRHHGSMMRLRERIKSLESENDRLKDQVDTLTEDKQELIREVIRLGKRTSGAFSPKDRDSKSPFPAAQSSPRRNPPNPTDGAESDSLSHFPLSSDSPSSNTSARPILKPPEKVSPPKTVHFDPQSVHQTSFAEDSFEGEIIEASGTIEQTFKNGRKVRIYKNGTRKEISRDGKCSTTTYFNGDVRQVLPDKEVYFYAANQTVHTIYSGGTEVFEFSNNQTEKIHPDGSREIHYPNLTVRTVFPTGDEQCRYPDGSTEHWSQATSTRTLKFVNGEEEIHTAEFKKRIFTDGTEKFQYPDGRLETRYAKGRVRIKDATGKLVFDSEGTAVS